MKESKRHAARLAVLLGLALAPSCSTVASWLPGGPERIPKVLEADRVPHAIERAEAELAAGRAERALDWMRAASAASGLPPETRESVQRLLEEAAERRVAELSTPDADPEDLAELVEMDLPRQIAVSAGIQAARRMVEQDEPMDAYRLVKKIDAKYPLHHERAAAGELLADIGLALSKDYSSFLIFYDRQDDAQEVLEYLILNYPRAPRCDEAYATLARIYADDRKWSFAVDRLEKLVLNHPSSPLRARSEARVPRFRLASIESPEYDRSALLRARRELEEWLRSWSGRETGPTDEEEPDLEQRVRLDLTDCLRRLSDSDRGIAKFYARVENDHGARRHAERAVEEARLAGDEDRIRAAERILAKVAPATPPAPASPAEGEKQP